MRSILLAFSVLVLTACGDDNVEAPSDMVADGQICSELGSCKSTSGCATGRKCIDVPLAGRRCVTASDRCMLYEFCGGTTACADPQTLRIPYGRMPGPCSSEYVACAAGCADAADGDGGVSAHCR